MFNLKTIIQNPKYFGLLNDIYLMEKTQHLQQLYVWATVTLLAMSS
ncbi:MAG: hypothetical protein H0X50_05355 [Nitrosopumilus sp.]|nr:hypothetical protein [Nitrosopumilus sp.]